MSEPSHMYGPAPGYVEPGREQSVDRGLGLMSLASSSGTMSAPPTVGHFPTYGVDFGKSSFDTVRVHDIENLDPS